MSMEPIDVMLGIPRRGKMSAEDKEYKLKNSSTCKACEYYRKCLADVAEAKRHTPKKRAYGT